MQRPLGYLLLALIIGLYAGDALGLPRLSMALLLPLILCACLICAVKHWRPGALMCVLALMFVAGALNITRYQDQSADLRHIAHLAGKGRLTLEGTVMDAKPIAQDRQALIVRCLRTLNASTHTPVRGDIRLGIPAAMSIGYGDFIRFSSTVKEVSGFSNPGGFDYPRHLYRQGIRVTGYVDTDADILLIRHHQANRFKQHLEDYRLHFQRLIDAQAEAPQNEILKAMTLGQKTIPADLADQFAATGTSHLLAISGLHVGIVAAAGYFVILLLLKSSEYLMLRLNILKIAAAGALIPVLLYALMAGMGTPVMRAAFMALAFLLALAIGRPRDLFNILFGAALIILTLAPEALFDLSFQLSFAAVAALISIVPRFYPLPLPFPDRLPQWLSAPLSRVYLMLLVTAAATAGTLPIIAFTFNRISAVTLLANLVCVPLLGFLTLIPALAALAIAPLSSFLASGLIQIASFFAGMALKIIGYLASLPWSSFPFIKPNLLEMILFYLLLFLVVELLTPAARKNEKGFAASHPLAMKASLAAVLVILTANGVYLYARDYFSKELKLTAIDVGQGSSTLIEFPRGVRMLVDGGGFYDSRFDIGKNVLAPFLHARRIRTIDIAVLTHPHPDHLQGLIYILNHFNVREVWATGAKADDDLYRLWEKTLRDQRVKVIEVDARTAPRQFSGATVAFYWPDGLQPVTAYDDLNDTSLVFQITFGQTRFLLTGDITSTVESQLIRSDAQLASDVLFVPHHGSHHSSTETFLDAVLPQYALVSAGKNNLFRHPHPKVLERYSARGIPLFRTDQQGAIMISTDGNEIQIRPFRDPSP